MIALWVDNHKCDIDDLPTIPIDFDVTQLTKVEGARNGRNIELELPATPTNDLVFGSSRDLYATKRFNAEHHTARIEKDGVTIFEGTAYLLETSITEGLGGSYKIRISEGGAEWIEDVVHGSLSDLEIPFSEIFDLATIAESWEKEHSVRFLPIYRGNYLRHTSSASALPTERVLLTDDYHPFISISDMVRAMFAKSGYTLHSNLLDSEFGRSLYMSGEYARTNAEAAKAKCDFLARRAAPGSATADFAGRVYASTAFATHTIGAIVDTANPEALDDNGEVMSDTFCINNSFSMNGAGNICFSPITSVKAGFLLHLDYTTEYKILSRERLRGFDVVEGFNGVRAETILANSCRDFRGATTTRTQYRVVVFDHTDGRQYQLVGLQDDNSSVTIKSWSTRSELVTTPSTPLIATQLNYRDSATAPWRKYEEDWALYAGYIEESGFIDVEMDFRLPPQDVAAGERFVLDKIWFGGADPGMKITVGTNCSLRPYFTATPGYNSMLEFKDIAPRNTRQVDLLVALGEMFNLAFYTDRELKEVHIEPLEELYKEGDELDWSCRIDHLGGVSISDAGIGAPQNFVLSYLAGDRASNTFNTENETTLGRWSFRNPLYGTKNSTKQYGNTLFTTTLNISNILGSAPSASVIQVGDIGEEENGVDIAFSPRIVCYKGLKDLPEGEIWSSPSPQNRYPYAAFIDDEGVNLCFEDRNNIEGLHKHYDPMLLRQSNTQKVSLDLYLTTAEIASLFTANGAKPSLRKKFRLNINGESSLFRLAKVEKWNTERNCLHCTFERELND